MHIPYIYNLIIIFLKDETNLLYYIEKIGVQRE